MKPPFYHQLEAYRTSPGDTDALLLALFDWQVAHNPAYAAFAAGATPGSVTDIPAVPVALFKDVAFSSVPAEARAVVFRTSGTTGRRGTHWLADTELYDALARPGAEAIIGPLPTRALSLVSHAPDASLGHMVAGFCPHRTKALGPAGVDLVAAVGALRKAAEPLFVAATAFALAELLSHEPGPFVLPEGSVVMVTGGFKGRVVQFDAAELTRAAHAAFPGSRVVGEYGMTELSSQLWAPQLGHAFVPPPWLRVWAVDPWSGDPTVGRGLLRFADLLNWSSVVAIETQDEGTVRPDGTVELHGRLDGAPARGCSLSLEEAWAARS